MPDAILLDALGTLVELQPPAAALRAELADRFGVQVTDADAERAIAAEITYYRAHFDEATDPERLADLRARCGRVVQNALALSGVDPVAMTQALLASLRFSAFPDVAPALIAARERGRRLVVVSNWDVSLNAVLDRLGLAPLLDAIVTSAAFGERKPAPGIFARALELAGSEPERAIHVGDSLAEDVAGARAAGIEPILIRRAGARRDPAPEGIRVIETLAELP